MEGLREGGGQQPTDTADSKEEGTDGVGASGICGAAALVNTRQRRKMPKDPASQTRVCYDHVYLEDGCRRWGCHYAHVNCARTLGGGGGRRRGEGKEERVPGGEREDEEKDALRLRCVPRLVSSTGGRGQNWHSPPFVLSF